MRLLTILAIALSLVVTGCSGTGEGTDRPSRGQSGPYIGGGAGVGF
jgi:predicted small secreted protein